MGATFSVESNQKADISALTCSNTWEERNHWKTKGSKGGWAGRRVEVEGKQSRTCLMGLITDNPEHWLWKAASWQSHKSVATGHEAADIPTSPGAESLQTPRSSCSTAPELCATAAQENTTLVSKLLLCPGNLLAQAGLVYFEPFFHAEVLGQETFGKRKQKPVNIVHHLHPYVTVACNDG